MGGAIYFLQKQQQQQRGFDNIGKVTIPQKVHTYTDISKTAHKITLVDLRTLLKPVA